jgi:hypothetical protein
MKQASTILLLFVLLTACNPPAKEGADKKTSIIGTWELISATSTQKDSTFSTFNPKNRMIKIITPTHFAFFNHDLRMGKDTASASYSAGGGTYRLAGDAYTENLEYFNEREWEGHSFNFKVTIQNDTLTQQGIEKIEQLGIDRIITEKYKRTNH